MITFQVIYTFPLYISQLVCSGIVHLLQPQIFKRYMLSDDNRKVYMIKQLSMTPFIKGKGWGQEYHILTTLKQLDEKGNVIRTSYKLF